MIYNMFIDTIVRNGDAYTGYLQRVIYVKRSCQLFGPIQGELQLVGGGNLHHCHVIQLIKIHAIHGYPTHISASQCRAVRQLIHTLCR